MTTATEGGSEGSDGSSEEESGNKESSEPSDSDEDGEKDAEENEEEEREPLSLEWPDTPWKRATYLFLLPILLPLWFTLPDVRNAVSEETQRGHHDNMHPPGDFHQTWSEGQGVQLDSPE